jgi:hypothetical protein
MTLWIMLASYNGSTDNTSAALAKLQKSFPLNIISHPYFYIGKYIEERSIMLGYEKIERQYQ